MPAAMHVVHIDTEQSWRGGQQQVYSLIQGLAEKGYRNTAVVRKGSALAERLKAAQMCELLETGARGEWDLVSAIQVRRYLIDKKPAVVHAHSAHAVALAALSTWKTSIPFVVTRRVDFHVRKNAFSRWKYDRAAAIIAISEAVKRILMADGVPEEKIRIVRSGVDIRRYQNVRAIQRREIGISEKATVIGQVAALAPHKDQITFLRAFGFLAERRPDIQAVIVGDGPLRAELSDQIEKSNLADKIKLLGFRPDALDILAGFDYFCLSSKEEGLGTSIIDAMMLRIPVVATRAGGIPELIEDGKTGFLADVHDARSLAHALERALECPPEALKDLIDRAYVSAQRNTISHTVSGVTEVYQWFRRSP